MNEIDHFMPILMKKEEEAEMTPLVSHGRSHFLWIKHNNLYRIHHSVAVSESAFPRSSLGSASSTSQSPSHISAASQILCHSMLKRST